jgi:hypothetical protein
MAVEKTNRMMPPVLYWLAVSVWLFPLVWWVWYFCAETDGT